MKLGIVGLPNVGKSTLFNAITHAGAESANYPFCTIEPNVGIVPVPDERLDILSEMYQPKKKTPAVIEFVDIAGLVKGASKGEGLGNQFLANIRETDAIIQVVRCFESSDIIHVNNTTDAARDMEIIDTELILADLEWLARRLEKTRKAAKGGDREKKAEADFLERLEKHLEEGLPARTFEIDDEEKEFTKELSLLSAKPVLYVANVGEDELSDTSANPNVQKVSEKAESEGAAFVPISAKIEEEIAALPEDESEIFLEELGLEESGLDRIVKASYELLGYISYLTVGPDECRAWTITRGMKAPQAAGKIHTDFERGFIRAEVVPSKTLIELGSMAACKEKGLVRSEGKDYVVEDGDVILFRFNV